MITLQRVVVAHYKGIQALDLTFPERGSFLIEGRNEAGKSTLFDAVHFALYGVPMVGDQASALHYGAEQMEVRLQLTVSGTRLAVWRRTRQTAKTLRSEAELTVVRPGIGSQADGPEEGDEETVRGAAAVSQRLQVELGGLTAEALLNSCLVAQKQLGRLETLSRASREDALTILLNLGKLSDVQARLKLRPQDDVQLNVARARVTWARATGEREVLAEDRRALETQRRYVQLQHGLAQLDALHAAGVTARMTFAGLQERLALLRAELTGIQSLKATQARWQRVQDVAQQTAAARRECIDLERRAAEARRAATDLPEAAGALERHQAARARAEALAGQQTRLKEIAQERERIAARVQERARLVALSTRLTAEIDRRRRERRDVATQINLLAPLLTEQQGLAARLAALQKLQQRVSGLGEVRRTLEDLESQVAERAEAEARYRAAEATLDAARAALAIQEALRRQRELCGALRRWREARLAADAAARARRLLEDLALAVAGVEHVTVRPETVLLETGEPD
ncbi:MAG: AAA family ATPase, partial [Chloroflexota bacterium]|nr:AAA family ATPase [Chloroflexota bacterium]